MTSISDGRLSSQSTVTTHCSSRSLLTAVERRRHRFDGVRQCARCLDDGSGGSGRGRVASGAPSTLPPSLLYSCASVGQGRCVTAIDKQSGANRLSAPLRHRRLSAAAWERPSHGFPNTISARHVATTQRNRIQHRSRKRCHMRLCRYNRVYVTTVSCYISRESRRLN